MGAKKIFLSGVIFLSCHLYLSNVGALELMSFSLVTTTSSYTLVPGGHISFQFKYEFDQPRNSSSNAIAVTFQAQIQSVMIDNSTAVIDDTGQTITFAIPSATFNVHGFGDHTCRFTLSTNPSDQKTVTTTVSYEEQISSLQITCDNFQTVDIPTDVTLQLQSGSNIHLAWYVDGQSTTTGSNNGNGSRQIQTSLSLNPIGQVTISVNVSNSVSSAMVTKVVNNYYQINGFSVSGTPSTLTSDSVITVKLASGANLPQGQLSLLVLYGDGTSDTQNVSSSQSNLQTGLNFIHRFSSLGSHQITLKITSPIDTKIYNSTIIVYDPISTVQVECSPFQKFGSPVDFNVTLPTGSNIQLLAYINNVFKFNTSYETHGIYVINHLVNEVGTVFTSVNASNPVSEAYYNFTFTNLHAINGFTLSGDETILNSDAFITLMLASASNLPQGTLEVVVNFNDSMPELVTQISSENETLRTSGIQFKRSFSSEGNYSVQMQLTSPVDVKTFTALVQVMEPINNIQIFCDPVQTYGAPVHVTVNITNGYNVNIKWLTNGNIIKQTFHSGKGIRTVTIDFNPTLTGEVNMTALAFNEVSEASSSLVFLIYYAINGFSLQVHPSTIYKNASIYLVRESSANSPQGPISVSVQYGDGNTTFLSINADNASFLNPGYLFVHHYSVEGQYDVVVNITSHVDQNVFTSTIDIIEPIHNISVLCFPENYIVGYNIVINLTINDGFNVESKWFVNGQNKFTIPHSGKGFRVYSDIRPYDEPGTLQILVNVSNPVSYSVDSVTVYNYYKIEGFRIYANPGTIYEDANIELKLTSGSRQPQGMIDYIIDFGDGNSTSGKVLSSDSNFINHGLSFNKRYFQEAIYRLVVILVSPIDSSNLTSEIKIVEPIRNITFWTKKYHEVGEFLVIQANLSKGFNVTTTWKIGSALSNVLIHEGTGDRYFNITESILEKGRIDITANATNIVSQEAHSYTTYFYHRINGIFLVTNVTSTVRAATIYLKTANSTQVPQGLIDVLVDFGDGSNNSTMLDLSSTVLIDQNVPFTHLYQYVGNYTVTGTLTSPLGTEVITSDVEVIQPIFGIEFECKKYLEVGEELVINATLFGGWRVTTEWNIGTGVPVEVFDDGNGTRHFQIRYNVTDIGAITITVNARNQVSHAFNSTVVFYLYPVNGFHISHGIYSILEDAEIFLNLSTSTKMPMGQIEVTTDFGDGNNNITILNGSDDTIITNGLLLKHPFSSAANYTVSITLTSQINSIQILSKIRILEPIYGIELLCPEYIEVGEEIQIQATLLGGHDVTTEWSFGNRSKLEMDHYGNGTREFTVTHNVSGSGEVNITVHAYSPVSVRSNSTVVFFYYGVNGFFIEGPTTLSNYDSTNVTIRLDSNALTPMGDISIAVMFGDGNTTVIAIESSNTSLLNPGLLFTHMYMTFGDFMITAQVTSHINSVNYTTSVELLEPTKGIEISCPLYNIVGNDLPVSVKLLFGTKLQLIWTFGNNNTAVHEKNGSGVRSDNFYQPIQDNGEINITVEALNKVSSVRNWTISYYFFEINGFYIENNFTVQTTEIASIFFKLSSNATQPQGVVDVVLFFGDGNKTHFNISSEDSLLLTHGIFFDYEYPIQGVYQLNAILTSRVGTTNISSYIHIWDKINVTLNSSTIVRVGEEIVFEFLNVPNSNFLYEIQYGDNETKNNVESDLNRRYDFDTWTKKYTSPNTYTVILRAWNPEYEHTFTYQILVEYPLVDDFIILWPKRDTIPIPDGKMDFILNVSSPSPTPSNVLCTFNYGQGELMQSNIPVTLGLDTPVEKKYVFKSKGFKNVTFFCQNSVSSIFKFSEIKVLTYTLNDINIRYENPVNMNMTLMARTPTDDNRHPYQAASIPVEVKFDFLFRDCSRLPTNMLMSWNFGDGSSEVVNSTKLYQTHQFKTRGIFNIVVDINDDNKDTKDTRNLVLQTGVLSFKVSPSKGDLRYTVFNMTAEGLLGEDAEYVFDEDSRELRRNETQTVFDNVTMITAAWNLVEYDTFGYYIPKMIGSNGTLVEIVYLDNPVIADLSIAGNELILSVPKSVLLPPGSVEYKLNIAPGKYDYRPFVFCTINTGDEVDRSLSSDFYNITSSNPFVYSYKYVALGSPVVNITCHNTLSTRTWTKPVLVFNECFEVKGIFDRQYSMVEFPMPVWTSENFYISNRMAIPTQTSCGSVSPVFHWEMFKVNESGIVDNNSKQHGIESLSGTLFIKAGTLEPGLYYLNLTVDLSSTHIYEYIYVKFSKPQPFAYIVGGSKTTMRLSNYILLDALEKSHTANNGFGNTNGLTFSWICTDTSDGSFLLGANASFDVRLNDTNITTTPMTSSSSSACGVQRFSSGVAKLPFNQDVGTDIAVTVTVFDQTLQDDFTQVITVVSTETPELAINCSFNCDTKVAIRAKASFMGWCKSCEVENSTMNYEWRLLVKRADLSSYEVVHDFSGNTTTDAQSLVIPENFLEPGVEYTLMLNASYIDQDGSAEVYAKFSTNFPPYNGFCNYTVETGTPLLSVFCKNWADEGYENDQNYKRDLKAKRPLIYQYETKTKRKMTHGIEEVVNIIYRGSESSIDKEYIQIGDSTYEYHVYFIVKIFDLFGDYTEVQSGEFLVTPPANTQPADVNDRTTVSRMFDNFTKDYEGRKRSGNEMAAIRLIGSTASLFKNYSNADATTTEDDIMTGIANTAYVDKSIFPIVVEYQTIMAHMLDLLQYDLQVHCDTNKKHRFSIADLQLIFSSVDSITRLQDYITFDILVNTTRLMDTLVVCFEKVTDIDPFPVGYLNTTYENAKVIHRIINRLLDIMLPNHLLDLSVPNQKNSIKEKLVRDAERQKRQEALLWAVNVSTLIDYTDLDNKAGMLFTVREHRRGIQEQQKDLAQEYFPVIQRILRRTQNVILRTIVLEERHTMDRTVLSVITEKITIDSIQNRTDQYFVGIQPSNGTFEQLTDKIVAMKINYYKKNPFIYGQNASSLTSGVSTFDMGDDIKLDVKLANNGNFKYQKFIPLINPEYPEKMIFFTFDVINDDDAAIIFMNPDGFDINNPVNFTLYTFYVSGDTFPTSSTYDFMKIVGMRDWENIGFKIFLEQGTCPKGTCYLGVKPEQAPDYSVYVPSQMRRKRSVVENSTAATPTGDNFVPVEANFSLVVFTTGCRSWNNSQNAWSSDGCMVLEMSSVNETVCRCSGNTFSTTFYVPPNMINFLTVFGKFDVTNAFVYGPLIGMLVIYIIAAVFLRREDKKDLTRWAVYFLVDHDVKDNYFYLLTVQTGMRRGAGTKSNVNFVLVGNEEDSGIRILSDGIKEGFGMASINRYFMGTKEPLGDLRYLRIWHDNTGKGAYKSWYLNRVIVDDLQERDRYVFLCEKWLSLDDDDGMIERVLPVSTKENVHSFKALMNANTQMNITDHHLWVSLLLRPNISRFTRVQRLTTLMVLLLLVMISNAMFFQSSTEDSSSFQMELGFIRFSLSTLYVSVIGVIITTPPILFVIIAFRKSKIRQKRHTDSTIINKDGKNNSAKYDVSKSNCILQGLNESIMFADNNLNLPFWFVYLAWITLVLAAAACAFFLLLYSMEWGKEKSEEWVTSFLLSFLESILFVDPLKVVFVSLIFATIFKSMREEKPPSIDLDELRKASSHYNGDSRQNFLALVNNVLKKNEPPNEEDLHILRKRRLEEKKARKAAYDILFFAVYIFVLFSASYLQRDMRSFNYKWNIENYLLANGVSQLGFSGINETKDFINWINRTLIPTFYPVNDYRGNSLSEIDKKWFGDGSSIRVGPARLRQMRSKREICTVWSITWPKNCVEKYSELDEETSPFCLGWNPYNKTTCSGVTYESTIITANAWKYTSAKDIWGFSILGEYNSYSGGGYILEFTKNREQAVAMLNELMKYYWIDRATRAIFLEFTVYNPNTNLFAYVIFLCEFPETGGTLIWTDIQSFRPVLSSDEVGAYAILCYIVIITYLLGYLFRIIYKTATKGCLNFFKAPWNIIDFILTILGFSCIGIYILRYIDAKKAMQMYSDNILTGTNQFINFGHIVVWDNLFNALFAIMVFISTLKMLRILGYNRKFTEIIAVVTNAGPEIAGFSVVFFVMFSAFVFFGFFLFGVHLEGYKSVFATCSTLANTFIGKNKLDTLMVAAPKTAQFYYFMYMVCVIMMLLTMFAAILNKSIAEVKAELAEYTDTIGIVDICWKSAKSFFGMFFSFKARSEDMQNKNENENMQKIQSMRNGSIEVSNVLALIRHTFNEFGDLQKKGVKQEEFSQLHVHSNHPPKVNDTRLHGDVKGKLDTKMHLYL